MLSACLEVISVYGKRMDWKSVTECLNLGFSTSCLVQGYSTLGMSAVMV